MPTYTTALALRRDLAPMCGGMSVSNMRGMGLGSTKVTSVVPVSQFPGS